MISQLTAGIYFSLPKAETDRPLLGLVSGRDAALMVDSGTSPGHAEEFLSAAGKNKTAPLKYQFLTHWHWDHVFGIPRVGAECIAHELTAAKLREMRGQPWNNAGLDKMVENGIMSPFNAECLRREMPNEAERIIGPVDRQFTDTLEIDLGELHCLIEHIGGTHTEDSSVLFVPEQKVLFPGDCIYGRRINGEYGYRLEELIQMTEKLRSYDAEYFLVSHEEPMKRDEFFSELDRMIDIGKLVGEETEYERAAESFRKKNRQTPTEEEAQIIQMFTGPNKK
ncbi:MAG: MBL fold metallo-hydrolase [Spirochaetia bacterium]